MSFSTGQNHTAALAAAAPGSLSSFASNAELSAALQDRLARDEPTDDPLEVARLAQEVPSLDGLHRVVFESLERADVVVSDETGWKLSTTRAAAVIHTWMALVAAGGEIAPLLAGTFPLERIADAQREFMQKRHVGNLVLIP